MTQASPQRGATLAVVVVVAAAWLVATAWVALGPLRLDFSTGNVAWRLANAWLWPTALLVVGGIAVRSSILATAALAAAVVEVLAFAGIVVVQVVLEARPELLVASGIALPTMLAGVAACIVAIVGARRSRRAWAAALLLAGACALGAIVLDVRAAAGGIVGPFGADDPLVLLAVALSAIVPVATMLALVLLAASGRVSRWASAALLAVAALLLLPGAIESIVRFGDAASGIRVLAAIAQLAAAVLLVVDGVRDRAHAAPPSSNAGSIGS